MKKWSIITGAVFLFLLHPAFSPAGVPPPEVAAAAEAGLAGFLADLPPGELPNFGFAEGEDLSAARLGDPWLLYTIHPDDLFSASETTDVGGLITPTGLWFFPVLLDGRSRCILTVAPMDGAWEAVSLGRAPLAGELEKFSRQWPRARGYSPKLILVYQAASYFFTVPEKGPDNLTPLTIDGVGFAGWRQKALPEYSLTAGLDDLLVPLREAVRENIAAFGSAPEGGGE